MFARLAVYLLIPVLFTGLGWRAGVGRPLFVAFAGSLAVAMICQLAQVVLYRGPVEANLRSNLLAIVAYVLPFVSLVVFPVVLRSGWRGVAGALLGTFAGLACATILLPLLELVRTKIFV